MPGAQHLSQKGGLNPGPAFSGAQGLFPSVSNPWLAQGQQKMMGNNLPRNAVGADTSEQESQEKPNSGSCIWLRDGLASLTLLLLRAVKPIFGADQGMCPQSGQMKNSLLQMQPKPFIGATLLMPTVTGGFLGQG